MKVLPRRLLMLVLLAIVVAGGWLLLSDWTSLQYLADRENRLRTVVQQQPLQAWLIGFGIYTCLSLIPGTPGKSVLFGWLFGFWAGVLMVDCALTLAALISFLISRFVLRSRLESRFAIVLLRWRRQLQHDAGYYLLMIRFMHAPFTAVNYGAGALNIVPLSTFWWTTQLGLLPGTMVFVYAGTRLPTLDELAQRGVYGLLDYQLLAALAATAAIPFAIRRLTQFWQRRAAADRQLTS